MLENLLIFKAIPRLRYEDRACSEQASLIHIDEGYVTSSNGAIASVWSGGAGGWVLRDGECLVGNQEVREDAGGETGRVYVSGAAIGGEETTVSTWLGYAFEQPVAVRCVIICQSEDIATRAETAFLERSHDGERWIPHATLALSAAANVIQANPCKLKYESEDLDQKRKKAYHRSAGAFGGAHQTLGTNTARDAFLIDSIVIAYPPLVRSVTGCIDIFWPAQEPKPGAAPILDHQTAVAQMEDAKQLENGYLERGFARFDGRPLMNNTKKMSVYANTYACPIVGNLRITLRGERLGSSERPTTIVVGGRPCLNVTYHSSGAGDSQYSRANSDEVSCKLPAGVPSVSGKPVDVVVARGDTPGLRDTVQYLAYQGPPTRAATPRISNIAARSVDLCWVPPALKGSQVGSSSGLLGALQTTGYIITYHVVSDQQATDAKTEEIKQKLQARHDNARIIHNVTLGNVTATTIIGLKPDTRYVFAVAAVVEDRFSDQLFIDTVDLYGRRSHLPGAFVGPFSDFTNATATLQHDVSFNIFNANATVQHGPADERATLGPTGLFGGEGSYGLLLVGSANIENCNASTACCDGFNVHQYEAVGDGCGGKHLSCIEMATPNFHKAEPETAFRKAAINDPQFPQNDRVEKRIVLVEEISSLALTLPLQPTASCGPAIRLTPSLPRHAGAMWYARRLNVREGFDTTIVFRTSNPSQRCNLMDDVYTSCQSRGGDGFAFVIQEDRYDALGRKGAGLGHGGINDSLAVEIDTYYNPELSEPYENHVAIHTNGRRGTNSAHQKSTLTSSTQYPRTATFSSSTQEFHAFRVRYDPLLKPGILKDDRFSATPHSASFFIDGASDFGNGLGALSIFIDDLSEPIIITPLDLDSLLSLHHGRAWVGATASTGLEIWQTHDVLAWNFTSLRMDPDTNLPPLINNGGTV